MEKICVVRWVDAAAYMYDSTVDDLLKTPLPIKANVGYVVEDEEGDSLLVISETTSYSEKEPVSSYAVRVPRCLVVEVKVLG